MNYAGLAELGWNATQTINGKNGYDDWDKMTLSEQATLRSQWASLPEDERKRLETIVCAATDAFARAIAV